SKTSRTITATDRVKEFGFQILNADGGKLFCTSCNISLDYTRRATVQRHLELECHRRKRAADSALLGNVKKNKTIASLFKKTTESSETRHLATVELVDAFASANIPLEKLDHPKLREFIQRNVQNAGSLPSANKLRQDYLPKIFATHFEDIKSLLNSCESFAIISDESTDEQDSYVLHVLFAEDVQTGKLTTILADCVYLDAVNYTTVSQAIIKTISKYGADFDKVSAFISDNATYMTKSVKSVLQGVMPNAVHITCNAHIISLVSELWRCNFSKVDKLVSYIKKIFKHCPSRKNIANATEKISEIGKQKIALSPEPVITRWNSWFQAVQYHAAHLKYYSDFVSEELTLTPKTQVLTDLSTLLNDAQLNDVQFVAKNATGLMDLITWFESRYVTIHEAYNKVMDVMYWAEAQSNENHSDNTELNARAQQVFSCMAKKLRQYYCYEEDSSDAEKKAQKFKQPATMFLKLRIFDPAQMHLLMLDLSSLNATPGFNKNCRLEIPAYKNIAKEADCTLPVLQFWKSVEGRIPHLAKLARRCLTIPTNSMDAERAVSKHRQVFSAQRPGMKRDTAAGCSMLTFNH
uniref:HAT C-terminal dimerisation domain-containing protein n=1 Tax=Latimeria chalumnae TaxID=7897 RepID=H3A8A2_LATCH